MPPNLLHPSQHRFVEESSKLLVPCYATAVLHVCASVFAISLKTEWCGQLQIMLKRRHILSDEGVHLRANTFPGPCTAAKSSPATKTK